MSARSLPLLAVLLAVAGAVRAADLPGKSVYEGTCVACHGPDGKGVLPGVPDFTSAQGPLAQSDEALKKHVIEGFQKPGSPMAMPPKGGNPALTDEDVAAALRYLRARFRP